MTKSKPPSIKSLLEQARERLDRHYLTDWLDDNHDELIAHLAGRRVNWEIWLEVFKGLNLTDRNGNPPTAGTARKAWLRVRTSRAKGPRVIISPGDQDHRPMKTPLPCVSRPPSSFLNAPSEDTSHALQILARRGTAMPEIINPRKSRKRD